MHTFMGFIQYIYSVTSVVCVFLTENTGSAGELLPDTGRPGVGVPASSQGLGHASALWCSS